MSRPHRHNATATHSGLRQIVSSHPLIAIRDCISGRRYALTPNSQELVLGGASHCDIIISDPYASAIHCSLLRDGERWILRDHGSKNGTRIDGTRIRIAELRGGSQIEIGDARLEIIAERPAGSQHSGLIGNAPVFLLAVQKARRAARSNCPVLILGETGTGKELIARTIHDASRRSAQAFVPVNCGAIPANLVRSELFGHAKGAFTGALSEHDGLFTQADGGTIFLDELGELPLEQQPLLLRALESRLIRRVGGQHEEIVNTRFVSATNRACLNQRNSPIREDLFHRLSTIVIELPPLRQRPSDVPLLVHHFLDAGTLEYGPRVLPSGVVDKLMRHEWRGNVRELRNSVSRALALGNQRLRLEDFLPEGVVQHAMHAPPPPLPGAPSEELNTFERHQRAILLEAYQRCGTIRQSALELGMPKSTFADMCKRYRIDTRRRKVSPSYSRQT